MKLARISLVILIVCLAGFGGILWFISAHSNPDNVTAFGKTYALTRGTGAEYECYFVRTESGDSVHTFYGSTDLLCAGPQLYWWDVDNDGQNELYCEACNGNSYLDFSEGKAPEVIEAGEGRTLPGLDSWLFRDLSSDFGGYLAWGSLYLLGGAAVAFVLVVIGLIIYAVKRKRTL